MDSSNSHPILPNNLDDSTSSQVQADALHKSILKEVLDQSNSHGLLADGAYGRTSRAVDWGVNLGCGLNEEKSAGETKIWSEGKFSCECERAHKAYILLDLHIDTGPLADGFNGLDLERGRSDTTGEILSCDW